MNRFLFLLILLPGLLPASAQLLPTEGVLLDSYAALVNGKVVTVGDVLSTLQPVQAELASRYQGRELEQKIQEEYNKARDALIESELILMDFDLQGGALPDRAIEDHINTVIHDRFDNDRAAFLRALAEERLTFAEWRKQMKDQLIVQVMRQREVSSKILIPPFDIQQAYDQMKEEKYHLPEKVRLRTLTLDNGRTAEEQERVLDQANDLRDRLLSGKIRMEQAADETGARLEDAEWFEVANLNETILPAIDGVPPGGISLPLEIGDRLYLIQVLERKEASTLSFDEAAPEIERTLRRAEFDRLNEIWLNTLRSKYYIQTFTHNLFD